VPTPTLHAERDTSVPPTPATLASSVVATSRFEETAYHRAELEAVKKENETLRRRVRELERVLSSRRQASTSSRTRSESASTSASVPAVTVSRTREREKEKEKEKEGEEDVVKVGESAASVGLGGGQ
jgi:hypothetical protein